MKSVPMTPLRTQLRKKRARAMIAFAYFAAIAAVVGWSSPKGIAAGEVHLAMRLPDSGAYRTPVPRATPVPATQEATKPRGKASCAECGRIESIQRIETRLEFTGWCDAAEIAQSQNSGNAFGHGFRGDRESLRESVAAGIAANQSTTKDLVTTRHRITVRLRDGKRQVFDEATPRMVNVGDRIVVIAGAPRTSG